MLSASLEAVLALIEELLPSIGTASTSIVAKVVATLVQIVPEIIQTATALVAPVQNIIATLQSSGAVTADQIAALQALDAQCDASFEAAAAADGLPNVTTATQTGSAPDATSST